MSSHNKFDIDGLHIGSSLFLIAGPCVIESEAHALKMAEAMGCASCKKSGKKPACRC